MKFDVQGVIDSVKKSLPSRERGLKYKNKKSCHAGEFASLPSRERGLKYLGLNMSCPIVESLPSRERGLKFPKMDFPKSHKSSLPSRERGLK